MSHTIGIRDRLAPRLSGLLALIAVVGICCIVRPQTAEATCSSVEDDASAVEQEAALEKERSDGAGGAGDARSASAGTDGLKVRLGLNGVVKVGHPCPLWIDVPADVVRRASWVEVETVDGDGVTVSYRQPVHAGKPSQREDGADLGQKDRIGALAEREYASLFMVIQIGRRSVPPVVRLLDANETSIAETPAVPSQWFDAEQPLVVTVGDSAGLTELVRTNRSTGTPSFALVEFEQAADLPAGWRGYAACDLLVVTIRNHAFLQSISREQWQAVDDFIRRGGACIVVMGQILDGFAADPRYAILRRIIPGRPVDTGMVRDPGLLESLVSTDQPIAPFQVVRLEEVSGDVRMKLADTLSRVVPWWIRSAHGNGVVQFVASDLGSGGFAEWKDRRLVWELLVRPHLDVVARESEQQMRGSQASYLGYNDLVGQLRATLDQFRGVRVVSLGQITVLLVLVLVLVGPVDYYLSVRWLRRPDLSWYFSSAVLVLSSLGLVGLYCQLRPDEIRVNTVQVIDVDADTGRVDGRLWSHVYSGRAHRLHITPVGQAAEQVRLDWQGLPGTGLGGLDSSLTSEHGMPPYRISLDGNSSQVQGVGIAAAGTKALKGTWVRWIDLRGRSQLAELAGIDQVRGTLLNPLDVDIHDAVLFYHNWFYRLPSRIVAGSSITIGSDNIPKDIARKLNERRSVEQAELVNKWDPADRDSVDRLLELMMFHKAASGTNYTSLQHRYELHMDFSNLLETDRAILIGWVERPDAALEVRCLDAPELKAVQEMDRVWCRLMIPVDASAAERRTR